MVNFWSYRIHKARLSNVKNRNKSVILNICSAIIMIIDRVKCSTYLAQITVYITDIEVYDGRKSAFFFNLNKLSLRGYSPHWNHTFRFMVIIGLV